MYKQYHYLKCEKEFFDAVIEGSKTFEIRKNDRDYKVGDIVYFEEVVQGVPTGQRSFFGSKIKYIFHGGRYGLEEAYCIFCWEVI